MNTFLKFLVRVILQFILKYIYLIYGEENALLCFPPNAVILTRIFESAIYLELIFLYSVRYEKTFFA